MFLLGWKSGNTSEQKTDEVLMVPIVFPEWIPFFLQLKYPGPGSEWLTYLMDEHGGAATFQVV